MNKTLLFAASLLIVTPGFAQTVQNLPAKGLSAPVSVIEEDKMLFITNIDNQNTPESGYILRTSLAGKANRKFLEGQLDSPRGFDFIKDSKVLIADQMANDDPGNLVVADLKSGRILAKLEIENSRFLNGVKELDDGIFAVTDTGRGRVYRVTVDKYNMINYETMITGISSPVGLEFEDNILYITCSNMFDNRESAGFIYAMNLRSGNKPHRWNKTPIGTGNLSAVKEKDDRLYVADAGTGKGDAAIYVFNVNTKTLMGSYTGNFGTLSGFDIEDGFIWAAETNKNTVKKIALASMKPAGKLQNQEKEAQYFDEPEYFAPGEGPAEEAPAAAKSAASRRPGR